VAGQFKPEFPPLLPPGRHTMTLPELRKLCVQGFALSTRRDPLMRSVEALCMAVSTALIPSEVWVDGSFVTQKMDPGDVDLVVVVQSSILSGTEQQRHICARIAKQDFKVPLPCDSYILVEYPEEHAQHPMNELRRAYWIKQFCFTRSEHLKGLAVIKTPIT
jgi:Family of unknown function (DUF6932)